MTTLALFKDLNKRANDLFTKDFPQNVKLEVKGSNDDFSYESNLTVKDGKYSAQFTPKQKIHELGNAEVKLDLDTDNKVRVEASIQDEFVKNLKVGLAVEQNKRETFSVLTTEFRHANASFNGSLDFGKSSGSSVNSSLVVGDQGVVVGGNVEANITNQALRGYKVLGGYALNELDVFGYYNRGFINKDEKDSKETRTVGISVFHKPTKSLSYGFDLGRDLVGNGNLFQVGVGYEHSKVHFNTNGELKFSYSQQFNRVVKVTIANKVNVQTDTKNSLGLGINFTF